MPDGTPIYRSFQLRLVQEVTSKLFRGSIREGGMYEMMEGKGLHVTMFPATQQQGIKRLQ